MAEEKWEKFVSTIPRRQSIMSKINEMIEIEGNKPKYKFK